MATKSFVDTNVLIYAAAGKTDAPEKYERSWAILNERNFCLSGQVLSEFYVNVRNGKKQTVPLTDQEAATWVDRLSISPVIGIDADIVRQGIAYSIRYKIKYWDAALIASAERLEVPIIYTEDLNDGQTYGSVRAINPYKMH
jgi:predicted nucleic acid-binding protein